MHYNIGSQEHFASTPSQSDYAISYRVAKESDNSNPAKAMQLSIENSQLENTDTFINFATESQETVGSISGQHAMVLGVAQTGVKLESAGADYAEYLEKKDHTESIMAAEVVGVFNGKISKDTAGADRVMVVSTMPLVIGNKQSADTAKHSVAVAFVGQVPVRVTGAVSVGDYVIASSKHDGTAIGINPAEITAKQLKLIIGRAWSKIDQESHQSALINVAITPLDLPAELLTSIQERQSSLEQENKELRRMIEAIQAQLNAQN